MCIVESRSRYWVDMTARSDTIRPLLPVLHLWRLLGVLPFARLDSSRVHVHVSPSSRFLCLVIVFAAGTAHVGREVWAFLHRERDIDLTRKVGVVMSIVLGLHVALSFSKKSCTIMQKTFRCVTQAGRGMESSPLTPLQPVLQVARCLGLLPFSQVDGAGVRLKLRHSRTIHFVGLGAIAALCLAAGVCLYQKAALLLANLQSPSISSDVTEFILNCFSIVIAITIVFFTRGSCEMVTRFLRYLSKVDTALLTTPGDPRRGLLHVLFGGVVWMARAAATVWLFSMPLCDALLYPLWFVILAAEQLTVVLCLELARRYRAINTVLQGMRPPRKQADTKNVRNFKIQELRADKLLEAKLAWLEPPPPAVQQDTPTTLTPARIEALREAHSSLADAFQELNSKLGVFLLIDLAYLFIVLLSTSISFLQHCIIKSTDQRGEPSFCVGYSLLAMDGLVRMGIITVSCGSVGEEAERTAEAAARLLRRALDWDALRELQILGAQVRARRVAFWACGLFTVDRPLLFSICGAVTSYLFILSQLK